MAMREPPLVRPRFLPRDNKRSRTDRRDDRIDDQRAVPETMASGALAGIQGDSEYGSLPAAGNDFWATV